MPDLSVLFVVASEDDGGIARVAATLARGLPQHGIRVAVALQREGRIGATLAAGGTPVHIVPELIETLTRSSDGRHSLTAAARNIASLGRAVRTLRKLARSHGASLLYSHGSWSNHLVAEATRGWPDRSLGAVWHVHTAYSRLNGLVAGLILRRGDVRAIIGVSHSVAAPYEGRGAPVHIVYNGISLDACDRARVTPVLRDRLGIARAALVIGFAGRLVAHKGIDVLVAAAQQIWLARPDAHIVVLGGNPASAQTDVVSDLRRRLEAAGGSGRVHLPGFIEDVLPWVAGFDIALVPSIYAEPFSLSIAEAMAVGVPVIASRIGGIPELIDNGRTGLLVRPGDSNELAAAVIKLAPDPERRREIGLAAQASAKDRFEENEMTSRVAAILKSVAR